MCDGVAKQIVLDGTARDGRTLRPEVVGRFKEVSSTEVIDCTVMKASWLSKNYPNKTVGSLVIYTKIGQARRVKEVLVCLSNAGRPWPSCCNSSIRGDRKELRSTGFFGPGMIVLNIIFVER